MIRLLATGAAGALLLAALPAQADELYAGVYAHEVDTPFTLYTGEDGVSLQAGYRSDPIEALAAIGRPAAHVFASVNTAGDTSFVAAGLNWTLGKGPVYVRPGIGLAVHDAPELRFENGRRTDLGSRVLFEPEIAVGYRVNERLSLEASWVHISNARLFDSEQNPGLDLIGGRVNLKL